MIHVDRSRKFADEFMNKQGYERADIEAVKNMIQCTAMNAVFSDIPFSSSSDRVVGFSLATADLLGQISADDYIDRLPQLYMEFKESYEYYGDKARHLYYDSAETLVANTPKFWESYVKPKLEIDCEGMYRFLNDPYPDGENLYLRRAENNIEKAAYVASQFEGVN